MTDLVTVKLTGPIELYHGSTRLYAITCYIRKNRLLLAAYLHQTKVLPGPGFQVPEYQVWRGEVNSALDDFERYFTNMTQPWTKQVIFLFALERLFALKISPPPYISSLLQELIPAKIIERPERRAAFEELVDWARQVDATRTLAQADPLFQVEFFTVMRQPIQFFADINTARRYAKGDDNLFIYTIPAGINLQLLDISNPETIQRLMMPPYPYSDWTPYTEDIVLYFTEGDLLQARGSVVIMLIDWFRDRTVQSMQAFDTEFEAEKKKWDATLRWTLPERRQTSWDSEDYRDKMLQGKSWPDFLIDMIEDLRQNHPEIWQHIAQKAETEATPLIAAGIQQKFPMFPESREDQPGSYDYLMRFTDFMDSAWSQQYTAWSQQGQAMVLQFLQKFVTLLGQTYGQINTTLEAKLPSYAQYRNWQQLGWDLKDNWNSWFEHEIVSPRGLWSAIHFLRLHNLGSKRLSVYQIDTLVIHTFITSPQLQFYQGWYDAEPYEVMISNPDEYGHMTKMTTQYAFDNDLCSYNLS